MRAPLRLWRTGSGYPLQLLAPKAPLRGFRCYHSRRMTNTGKGVGVVSTFYKI